MSDDGEGRIHPRESLVEVGQFGVDPAAQWLPVTDRRGLRIAIAAYWQHLAVCALREKYPVRTAEELAAKLGDEVGLTYLKRQLSGEYPVSMEELAVWALVLGDVTILPAFDSAAALCPPGIQLPT